MLDTLPIGVLRVDEHGNVTHANPAALELFGGALHARADTLPLLEETGEPLAASANPVLRTLATGERASISTRVGEGADKWLEVISVPFESGAIVTLNDITVTHRQLEELDYSLHFDTLTGLPNRRSFFATLQKQLHANESESARHAIVLVDINDFKQVNKLHGHEQADGLLRQFADRIKASLRPDDLLARIGGDEFAILLKDIGSVWHAARVAETIVSNCVAAFPVGAKKVELVPGVGISVMPKGGADTDMLFSQADVALRRAKQTSNARFVVYDAHLDAQSDIDLELAADLEEALDRNELHLAFQPIVDMRDGSMSGAETLLRWEHPVRGSIPPSEFVPLAEESGSINRIGAWVLDEAARHLASWLPHHPNMHLSINLSPSQLESRQFLTGFARTLGVHGVPHNAVMLELTETYLMEDVDRAARDLRRFVNMGVAIAIDDFGTGYSSMKYLQLLPVTHVKIDRSFIGRILMDERSRVLVEAILLMAEKLNLRVIAEGVETIEQAQYLQKLGCNFAQGWLYGRAVPSSDFSLMLKESLPGSGF